MQSLSDDKIPNFLPTSVSSDGQEKMEEESLSRSHTLPPSLSKNSLILLKQLLFFKFVFSFAFNYLQGWQVKTTFLLLIWKPLKILWVEIKKARRHFLDAVTLHDQNLVIFFIAPCGTTTYTEMCGRKGGEQLRRIILYGLDQKKPTGHANSYLFI